MRLVLENPQFREAAMGAPPELSGIHPQHFQPVLDKHLEELHGDKLAEVEALEELNHVYFENRSFSSSGSRVSLTQRRSAMTKGSPFRRASKSPTRRVRSCALAWQ